MGFTATTLKNLPDDLNYYFFLIGDYNNSGRINDFFRNEFINIASRIGTDAGIIQQTRKSKIEEELSEIIDKLWSNKKDINVFLDFISNQYPGLLILNKHPDDLTDKDNLTCIPFTTLDSVYSNTDELFNDLVGLANGKPQLLDKVVKWAKDIKRKVSIKKELNIGINLLFFSIGINVIYNNQKFTNPTIITIT